MAVLTPSAEPSVFRATRTGIGLTNSGKVHSPHRMNETRRWFFVGLDDGRWDYRGAVLDGTSTTCARSGERAFETLETEIAQKGWDLLAHRTTLGPCWTSRAEWHTGLFCMNHGMTTAIRHSRRTRRTTTTST
jgi:hypothetical protein